MDTKESLTAEKNALTDKIPAVFMAELSKICEKHSVEVISLYTTKVLDLEGNDITEGDAYDAVWELINWVEDDMDYQFQSFICTKEEQIAH